MQSDLFATKGLEYMLVIAYLVLLVACWRFIFPRRGTAKLADELRPEPVSRWFFLPDGFYFHQGHAWAAPDERGVMRVGIDDFARKLLGLSVGVVLPPIGTRLAEGEPGWQLRLADGSDVPMLSPVAGEVVSVNPEVLLQPALMNSEPYDRGWLMKVRVPTPAAARRNLLTGDLARAWIDGVSEKLPRVDGAELGIVLSGGTFGATGFARALSPDGWQQIARDLLLVAETPEPSAAVKENQPLPV
jgi:glycine cleavage system H lipoate-binding protein